MTKELEQIYRKLFNDRVGRPVNFNLLALTSQALTDDYNKKIQEIINLLTPITDQYPNPSGSDFGTLTQGTEGVRQWVTRFPYVASRITVVVSGVTKAQGADIEGGYVCSDPTNGEIVLNFDPDPTDTVSITYYKQL